MINSIFEYEALDLSVLADVALLQEAEANAARAADMHARLEARRGSG